MGFDPALTFGVLAGVTQLIGYGVYLKLNNGHSNTGSWLIWTLSAGVDLVSYDFITQGDIVKEILPAVCALACIATFFYLLARRRFGMPDKTDWGMILIDMAISMAWWQQVVGGVTANLLLQGSTVFSAIPMVRGILKDNEQEKLAPWVFWLGAYLLHATSVLIRLSHWSELTYPVANTVMCLMVIGSIRYKLRSTAKT